MLSNSFRERHLFTFLEAFERDALPLDVALNLYFRRHKALGAKDRKMLAETVYSMTRWRGLLDYLCQQQSQELSWPQRYACWLSHSNLEQIPLDGVPAHVRCSFPKALFDMFAKHYGEEKALQLCLVANTPAPTTIRANAFKTTREALMQCLQSYACHPCKHAPHGIVFEQRYNLFGLEEFKQGLFEVQDEASQLVAALVKAQPGEQIMDYCAGSGGKALAFGAAMQNKGQIHLHDVRQGILVQAKKRLKRAGLQNTQIVLADDPKLNRLKKRMDWVLVDAPCSGTGTLRRNPDMKWKLQPEDIERLVGQQRHIFEKALSYLAPEGRIVYATCSILPEENQQQIEHFMRVYGLTLDSEPFCSLPERGGMDGFFGAVLKKC